MSGRGRRELRGVSVERRRGGGEEEDGRVGDAAPTGKGSPQTGGDCCIRGCGSTRASDGLRPGSPRTVGPVVSSGRGRLETGRYVRWGRGGWEHLVWLGCQGWRGWGSVGGCCWVSAGGARMAEVGCCSWGCGSTRSFGDCGPAHHERLVVRRLDRKRPVGNRPLRERTHRERRQATLAAQGVICGRGGRLFG